MLIAAPVLNRIAESQPLKNEWVRKLFLMNQDELTRQHETQEQLLAKKGYPTPVILSYLTVAPLLAENEAISKYIEQTGNLTLRSALPELTTVNEAVLVATKEHRLNPSMQLQLKELLNSLYH